LCEAAHNTVQGDYSEKKLINSAKSVADSTEKLLIACQANADKNSKMQKGLQVRFKLYVQLPYDRFTVYPDTTRHEGDVVSTSFSRPVMTGYTF